MSGARCLRPGARSVRRTRDRAFRRKMRETEGATGSAGLLDAAPGKRAVSWWPLQVGAERLKSARKPIRKSIPAFPERPIFSDTSHLPARQPTTASVAQSSDEHAIEPLRTQASALAVSSFVLQVFGISPPVSDNVRRNARSRVRLTERAFGLIQCASTGTDVLTDCASELTLDCASATFRLRAATHMSFPAPMILRRHHSDNLPSAAHAGVQSAAGSRAAAPVSSVSSAVRPPALVAV